MSAKELLLLLKELPFNPRAYRERIDVILQNNDVVCPHGYQLGSFHRKGYLAIFSLPDHIDEKVGRAALKRAIEEFHAIDKERQPTKRDQQVIVYRAYYRSPNIVSITSDVVNAGTRWYLIYRSLSKMSKSQSTKHHERLLRTIDMSKSASGR